jgi:methylenetetrahydrofolate--tRNA-(uracil-5-)-methyltransferase
MGLLAGINMARIIDGNSPFVFPAETAIGSLALYISNEGVSHFQPMNINFGLMPPINERIKDKNLKNRRISERSINKLKDFIDVNGIYIV